MPESYLQLFWRFLRFGLLAWGGPVAQIAMIRQELVEEEQWISPERFNRVLAVYQVLPGPEAHELCVYFGLIKRGRLGGLLAGLGFMLPGFMLMMILSWFYVTYGITSPLFAAIFNGFKPAVAALILRAIHRLGQHAIYDRWLLVIALLAAAATLAGMNFLITLLLAGLVYELIKRQTISHLTHLVFIPFPWPTKTTLVQVSFPVQQVVAWFQPALQAGLATPSLFLLLWYGLRTGLLTFGGAYTAIPFLQHDAVEVGSWMSNAQFLDGLALSGILPAPLIIFSTFVGYLGGGPGGAIAMTIGVFAPAFAFTLIGHDLVERLVENRAVHTFLDGVTAGVVGLIAAASLKLLQTAITDLPTLVIFLLSLFLLYRLKSKTAVAVVMLIAGLLGKLFLSS